MPKKSPRFKDGSLYSITVTLRGNHFNCLSIVEKRFALHYAPPSRRSDAEFID